MYKTEQEAFWAGDFGNDYVERNRKLTSVANRTAMFADILASTRGVRSVLELGANIGLNLIALGGLLPEATFSAVEINDKAIESLSKVPRTTVRRGSILEASAVEVGLHDLTFTSGVLIHINPEFLSRVYSLLFETSKSYICVAEYYNPSPAEVPYRGHGDRLYKRDFAGEILDKYPDLELVNYGFRYRRDANFPMDDLTWFLLRKRG